MSERKVHVCLFISSSGRNTQFVQDCALIVVTLPCSGTHTWLLNVTVPFRHDSNILALVYVGFITQLFQLEVWSFPSVCAHCVVLVDGAGVKSYVD